jgi:hypothetical protein
LQPGLPFEQSANCDRMVRLVLIVAVALVAAAPAAASVMVAKNAKRPALKVNAGGYAEISWTERGVRRTLLVPPRGGLLPGGRIRGPDVSGATTAVAIPFARAIRQTPDGRYWALQSWRVRPDGPVELRFSRWRGAPTRVAANVILERRLSGAAEFGGKPVPDWSRTPEGRRVRTYVHVDCFGCLAAPGSWRRLLAVAPRSGAFAVALTPERRGTQYRVSLAGPNVGAQYAPDATALVDSGPPPPLATRP